MGISVMTKQRLIFLVATLCLAQLAIVTSRQISDRDSDLHFVKSQLTSAASAVGSVVSRSSQTAQSDQVLQPTAARQVEPDPSLVRDNQLIIPDATTTRAETPNTNQQTSPKKQSSKRDPFVPFFSLGKAQERDIANPLTSYSLGELRVVAIMSDFKGTRSASVEAPDGKSFIVRAGTKVGEDGGTVERITPTTIVISEPTSPLLGDQKAVIKELSLKRDR